MTGGGAGGREWIRFCGEACNRALRGGTGSRFVGGDGTHTGSHS